MKARVFSRLTGPVLALFSLTLLALGTELVFRILHTRELERIRGRDPTRELCTEPDPELMYRYVPGQCGHNRRGYRDGEHELAARAGVFRFVVIGDSVAAGHGVALGERFDRVLERRLATTGVRAEAVNLARTGYSTSQEIRVLEREGYAYHPDVVLWSYVLNDPAHPIYHNANGQLGTFFARPRLLVWQELGRLLFKLRERIIAWECPAEFHLLLHCVYARQVTEDIAHIGALSTEHKTPILFVIHPTFERDHGFSKSSFAPLHAALAREARHAGLVVVDLLDAYAPFPPDALRQTEENWLDPWHPNAQGHALAAEAIERVLREIGTFAGAADH